MNNHGHGRILSALFGMLHGCVICINALILFLFIGVPGVLFAEEKTETVKKAEEVAVEQKVSFIQLHAWATILPKELIDLQKRIKSDTSVAFVSRDLLLLVEEVEQLRWEATIAMTNPEIQLPQVSGHQNRVYKMTGRLEKLSEPIQKAVSSLSTERKEWLQKKEQVVEFGQRDDYSLILGEDQLQELVLTIDKSLALLEEQLRQVLDLGKKIGDQRVLLYAVNADLKMLEDELKTTSVHKTSPSILSGDFYSRINVNLFHQSVRSTKRFLAEQSMMMEKSLRVVVFTLIGLIMVGFAVYHSKTLVSPSSPWYPFAVSPVATTFFMASSLGDLINIMPIDFELPAQWQAALHLFMLVALIFLTMKIVKERWWRQLLITLIVFMGVIMAMVFVDLPQFLIFLYVFYISLVAFIYYICQLPRTAVLRTRDKWGRRVLGVFPAIILIMGVSGYDQFAVIAFSTCLMSVVAVLVVWMLYKMHLGLLDLVLSSLPFAIVKEHQAVIVERFRPILLWIHIFLLIAVQTVIWSIFSTVNEAMNKLYNMGVTFAGIKLSPGFFFSVVIVIYIAFLVSKAIQTLLISRVLPRYGAKKGVQLAIARLVHYAILLVGFLVMLRLLGFQLDQITLLGGALGVGIGFGLQAIVNNFASGLILLFERPIKVGDTIQIGSDLGEVKEMGLRATIIQTFDNAEIVVPNSDLITGQVINWTLADRRVRVRIPVGVAYGTDVSKVLEILLIAAKANPMVLSTPAPSAFFLAFGESSLDFEVRVWIPEFLDKVQVLSDLNQDIENEFALQNIEIPFPQRDLHLRSVDQGLASTPIKPQESQGSDEQTGTRTGSVNNQ